MDRFTLTPVAYRLLESRLTAEDCEALQMDLAAFDPARDYPDGERLFLGRGLVGEVAHNTSVAIGRYQLLRVHTAAGAYLGDVFPHPQGGWSYDRRAVVSGGLLSTTQQATALNAARSLLLWAMEEIRRGDA